jgi:dihydroorotase
MTQLKLPFGRLIEMLSSNPQRIMKVTPWVCLKEVRASDDPGSARSWKFDVAQSKSKSRNSPFHGWNMTGKAVTTIVHGEIVYEDRGSSNTSTFSRRESKLAVGR